MMGRMRLYAVVGAVLWCGWSTVSFAQEQKAAAPASSASSMAEQQSATAQTPAAKPLQAANAGELVIFDFEKGLEEWAIPDWAQTSPDYVGKNTAPSQEFRSRGQSALELVASFPGGKWTGAYVERTMYVTDWSAFSGLAADLYLPQNAPEGLKARFILSVGDKWEWTEMNRALPLKPGAWTTLTVDLKPGSQDWKFFPDEKFRKDIRKVGIRIESDAKPAYTGPVYVDNVRLAK